jgi:hypothetical protein
MAFIAKPTSQANHTLPISAVFAFLVFWMEIHEKFMVAMFPLMHEM